MLELRTTHRLGEGSLAWVEDYCSETSLAYLNGNTLVMMNVGADAMPLPAGETILRSSAVEAGADLLAADLLGSGETIWLTAS
jgi:alpha-glucosidase